MIEIDRTKPEGDPPEIPADTEVAMWWALPYVIGLPHLADWLQWWLQRRMQLRDWFYGSAALSAGLACVASGIPLLNGLGICIVNAATWYLVAVMLPLVDRQPLRFVVIMTRNWAALNIIGSAIAAPLLAVFIFIMTDLN